MLQEANVWIFPHKLSHFIFKEMGAVGSNLRTINTPARTAVTVGWGPQPSLGSFTGNQILQSGRRPRVDVDMEWS